MQCKDIPDGPILELLAEQPGKWFTWYGGYDNSLSPAFPAGCPDGLVRAKMAMLIRRGLVGGCTCGCRGDFEITDKGMEVLRGQA